MYLFASTYLATRELVRILYDKFVHLEVLWSGRCTLLHLPNVKEDNCILIARNIEKKFLKKNAYIKYRQINN